MKNILIIRSVSFQQLDLNLSAIREKYSPCKISLLTHEHGVKLAEKYSEIEKVYVYPYKEGFNYKNKVDEMKDMKFDAVVVPVTNINGGGFFNVLKFSKSFNTKERVMCNVVSDIKYFNMRDIYLLEIKTVFMKVFSMLATAILSPVILICLLFRLNQTIKK